ncbi:hypothetical protein PROFUN_16080 [Planoprotostelium fungivorum]|uniref:Uncharacterized protein n=1 Tax=Planoprotostelium fungivorum TaxID=1890364 RepID=A0A2P6MXJ1_9EUKA|nr:hypothetical protein PROFUN_16080 [Planoprotostelium fungivorum]
MSYYHVRSTTKQANPILKKDVDHAIRQCLILNYITEAAAVATLWATAGRYDSMQWVAGEDIQFLMEEINGKLVFDGFALTYNKMKQGATEGLTYYLQDRDLDNEIGFARRLLELLIKRRWLVFVSESSPSKVDIDITENTETLTSPPPDSRLKFQKTETESYNHTAIFLHVCHLLRKFLMLNSEEERDQRKRSASEELPEPAQECLKIVRTVESFEEFQQGIAHKLVPEIAEFAHKHWLFTWDDGAFSGNLLSTFSAAKGTPSSTKRSANLMYQHYQGKRWTLKQMNNFLNHLFFVLGFQERVLTTRSFRRGKITVIAIQRFFCNGGGWKEGDVEYISDAMGWRDKEHIKRYMDNVVRKLRSFTDLDSGISENTSLNTMDFIFQSIISAFEEEGQAAEPPETEVREETVEMKEIKRMFVEQEQLMKKYGEEYDEEIAIGKQQSSLYQSILLTVETGREPNLIEYSPNEVEAFIAELNSKFRAKKLEPIMTRMLAKWSVERKIHQHSKKRSSVTTQKEWDEKTSEMVHNCYAMKTVNDIHPDSRKFFSVAMDPQFRDVMAKHLSTAIPEERRNDYRYVNSQIISFLFGKYHKIAKNISFVGMWRKIFRNTGISMVVKGFCVQYAQHHFKSEFNPNFQVGDVVPRNPHKNKRTTDDAYTSLHREAQEKMYDLFKGPIPRLTASGEKMEKFRAIHTELEIPITEIEKSRTTYKSVLQRSEKKKISFKEALAELFDYHNSRRGSAAAIATLDAFFPADKPPTPSEFKEALKSLTAVERKYIVKRKTNFKGYLKRWKLRYNPSPSVQKNLLNFFKKSNEEEASAKVLDTDEVLPETLDTDDVPPQELNADETPAKSIQLAVMTEEDMQLFNTAPTESLFTCNRADYFGEDPKEAADDTISNEKIIQILRDTDTFVRDAKNGADMYRTVAEYHAQLRTAPEGIMRDMYKSLLAESQCKAKALWQKIEAAAHQFT